MKVGKWESGKVGSFVRTRRGGGAAGDSAAVFDRAYGGSSATGDLIAD